MSLQGSKSDRQFIFLVRLGATVCLGLMFGFFASIRQVNPRVQFGFGWEVIAAGLVGGAVVWWFIGKIFSAAEAADSGEQGKRRGPAYWTIFFILVAGGITIIGFGLAMRGAQESKISDVAWGSIMAFWVLSFGGYLVWHIVRFLEEDSARGEAKFREETERKIQAQKDIPQTTDTDS
jgi:hypothetical protein